MLSFLYEHQGLIAALATVVIAISAVVTMVLTRHLARENRLLRRASTEPEVIVYLNLHLRYRTVLVFVIENIGRGMARNVRYCFEEQKDFEAHSVQLNVAERQSQIHMLAPGQRMEWWFGQAADLLREPILAPFQVSITYEAASGETRKYEYHADVSQFKGIDAGRSSEEEMADALKNIERHVGHWTSGLKRIKAETITTVEARKEIDEWRRKIDSTSAREQDGP